MPNTIKYEPGDVVLVPFPFADLTTAKRRPALVVASVEARKLPSLVVVAMITSRLDGEAMPGDCDLAAWREAGLLHSSKVRLAKIVSLEKELVLKRLGALAEGDHALIGKALNGILSAWSSAR